MKVKELVEFLNKFDENTEVCIIEGFNGGGDLRVLNYNNERELSEEDELVNDGDGIIGNKVIALGYGCY